MATNDIRARVIAAARKEVGYRRNSNRWNKYARDVYPSVQYQAYCGVFVAWVIKRAGVDVRDVTWLPYIPTLEAWAKKSGAWKTKAGTQKDGDLVVFGFGRSSAQHVGFSWRDEKASGYRSIEGNTSTGSAGSQANGGAVAVRYRGRASIRGWVDLDKLVAAAGYKPSVKPSTPAKKPTTGKVDEDGRFGERTVQEIQQRLKKIVPGLDVDGRAGEGTWKALQKALGTVQDGLVSHQSYKPSELGNGIVNRASAWGYDGRGAKGSTMVRALQKAVGAKVDGVWGEGTTKALQKKLNADTDFLTKKV